MIVQVADEVGTPAHDLYVRTHGAYAPGEQRKRDYNWDNTGLPLSSRAILCAAPSHWKRLVVGFSFAAFRGIA